MADTQAEAAFSGIRSHRQYPRNTEWSKWKRGLCPTGSELAVLAARSAKPSGSRDAVLRALLEAIFSPGHTIDTGPASKMCREVAEGHLASWLDNRPGSRQIYSFVPVFEQYERSSHPM